MIECMMSKQLHIENVGVSRKSSLSFMEFVFAHCDWHGNATRNYMNSAVYYRTLSDIPSRYCYIALDV